MKSNCHQNRNRRKQTKKRSKSSKDTMNKKNTKNKPQMSKTNKTTKNKECRYNHNTYTTPQPYKIIDQRGFCTDGQELCQCKCKGCKCLFVDDKTGISNEYKPSTQQLVYACFNVNECNHALCKECWIDITVKKGTARSLNKESSIAHTRPKRHPK